MTKKIPCRSTVETKEPKPMPCILTVGIEDLTKHVLALDRAGAKNFTVNPVPPTMPISFDIHYNSNEVDWRTYDIGLHYFGSDPESNQNDG